MIYEEDILRPLRRIVLIAFFIGRLNPSTIKWKRKGDDKKP
jgi:hypothetical protein